MKRQAQNQKQDASQRSPAATQHHLPILPSVSRLSAGLLFALAASASAQPGVGAEPRTHGLNALTGVSIPAVAVASAVAGNAGDAAADPVPAAGALVALKTVTVTAERREADLLDTPLAVSAISAEQIERGRLESIRELLGTVPGLVTPGSIGNMQSLFVRGIGTSNPGFYPAVAFYIDDVYRPRPFGVGFFSLPDIERIEVLRGPQGTLYGQNSSGGALRLISRDPGDFPETRLGLGIGTDGYREASAYLARPIKQDVLSIGFAASSRRTDGFTYNALLDKQVDAVRLDQARLKLQLTPNENSSAVLALDLGRDQTDNALYIPVGYPGASPRVTFAAVDTRLDRKDRGVSLHYRHALGERLEFKSITASRWFDDDPSPWDQDGEPAFNEGWVQYIDQQQFSQEFQLSGQFERLSFTSGLVYFREHLLFDRLTHLSERYSELNSDLRSESRAIYGQFDYRLGDRLTATVGGRYSEDKQEFANESFRNTPTGERTAQVYAVSGLEDDWNSFTPKLGLSLDLNPDTLLYLSATRGEKIGGYNRAAATAQIASLPVGPEKVTAFESGWKQRYLDGRAQTTLAVFFNDFRDYQAAVSNPVINGEFITGSVLVNAAEARTWGAELEAALKVSERFELSGSAAYLRSRFDDFVNPTGAAATDFSGKELPTAPRWSFSANAVYDIPLATRGRVSANAQVRYVSEQFSDIGNTPQLEVKPQTYVNAGLNWITGSAWSFSLTAKNLLDKTYAVNLKFRAGVSNQAAYNPPRQIVLGARYDF